MALSDKKAIINLVERLRGLSRFANSTSANSRIKVRQIASAGKVYQPRDRFRSVQEKALHNVTPG